MNFRGLKNIALKATQQMKRTRPKIKIKRNLSQSFLNPYLLFLKTAAALF